MLKCSIEVRVAAESEDIVLCEFFTTATPSTLYKVIWPIVNVKLVIIAALKLNLNTIVCTKLTREPLLLLFSPIIVQFRTFRACM